MRTVVLVLLASFLAGCGTSYTTPGSGANLGDLSSATPEIAELMQREPAATPPWNISVVRVQSSSYAASGTSCRGGGAYCVVQARDVERDEDYRRIAVLDGVAGVAPVNSLLMGTRFTDIDDLRVAAARLQSNVLLVYTIDTRFSVGGQELGPLSVISLGLIPNKKAYVSTTASAVLVDVLSGFIYGQSEASASEEQRSTVWSTHQAIETARRETERESFRKLVDEFVEAWPSLVARR